MFNFKIIVSMKKVLFMAVVMLAACEERVEVPQEAQKMKKVTFEVASNGWSVMTRGLEADGQEMTDLWLFDYVDGVLVQTVHKSSGDVDFAQPSVAMTYGEHSVYFVAARGKTPTVSGTEITWASPSDTFWKAVSVTVGSGSASSVAVALDRVVTKLRIAVNDEVPTGTASLEMTQAPWYAGIDYLTGAAVGESDDSRTVAVPASYIGTSGQLVVNLFSLSDDDEWTADVSIVAKDGSGGVLGRVDLEDVPFVRNRVTEASGNLFAAVTTFDISLNAEWRDSYVIEW